MRIFDRKTKHNFHKIKMNSTFACVRNFGTTAVRMSRLSGKVAIVTASTQGIGLAISKKLQAEGAKVVISSRKASNVEAAMSSFAEDSRDRIHGVVCHVAKREDREKLIEETISKFGGIDILVSNAGTNPVFGPMLECSEDAWDKIFDTNVKASFLLAKSVFPHMKNRGAGSIVFISSIVGFHPIPMIMPYSVSKTALLGLTKALSWELAPENVRVNCIAPGIVDTKFAGALTSNDYIAEKALENTHIKRFGQPEDIGGIVSFLCSEEASYITGENIVVGGGMPSRQ